MVKTGIFSKVLPWKKKDELALGNNLGLGGLGAAENPAAFGGGMQQAPYDPLGGMAQMGGLGSFSQPPQPESFRSSQAYDRSYNTAKDIEVVSAKLDAIKSALEALNQRLAAIERYIQTEQDFKRRGGWQ